MEVSTSNDSVMQIYSLKNMYLAHEAIDLIGNMVVKPGFTSR